MKVSFLQECIYEAYWILLELRSCFSSHDIYLHQKVQANWNWTGFILCFDSGGIILPRCKCCSAEPCMVHIIIHSPPMWVFAESLSHAGQPGYFALRLDLRVCVCVFVGRLTCNAMLTVTKLHRIQEFIQPWVCFFLQFHVLLMAEKKWKFEDP